MTGSKKKGAPARAAKGASTPTPKDLGGKPDWTRGLRQLYDSVVDEPLPDEFKNLLDKLDNK